MSNTTKTSTFDVEAELEALATKWASTFVARSEFGRFSGGLISPKTVANADAMGTGPAERRVAAGKVVYSLKSALEFLRGRLKPSTKDTGPAQQAAAKKRAAKKRTAQRGEVAHG